MFGVFLFIFVSQLEQISTEFSLVLELGCWCGCQITWVIFSIVFLFRYKRYYIIGPACRRNSCFPQIELFFFLIIHLHVLYQNYIRPNKVLEQVLRIRLRTIASTVSELGMFAGEVVLIDWKRWCVISFDWSLVKTCSNHSCWRSVLGWNVVQQHSHRKLQL